MDQNHKIDLDYSILPEIRYGVPDDLPAIELAVNHLEPLRLPAQFACYVNGLRLAVTNAPDTPVLRANRNRLRRWLATNITITYGKQAVGIEEAEEAATVHFRDGTKASGDIVVGADGANSYGKKTQFVVKSILLTTISARVSIVPTEQRHASNESVCCYRRRNYSCRSRIRASVVAKP